MAVNLYTIGKPYIWLQAVTGGTLSPATYYIIGWNSFCPNACNAPYYGNVAGVASEQVSVTTDATNNRIKMEIYYKGGDVTAYANAGGGLVTVTATAHGLNNGDSVWLRGTANYTGKYTISNVTTNTFDITATWVSDDGASKWFSSPGVNTSAYPQNTKPGFYFKWDYYSMLRGDGSYVHWCNTNDPRIDNEWSPTEATPSLGWNAYGHDRWGGLYYSTGMREIQMFTDTDGVKYKYLSSVVISSSGYQYDGKLYQRSANGGGINGLQNQPQIASRKYTTTANETADYRAFTLPSWIDENSPAVLIWIDSTNSNNQWYHITEAIKTTGKSLLGKSISISNDNYTYYNPSIWNVDLHIRGSIIQDKPATGYPWTSGSIPAIFDKRITLYHGNISGIGNATADLMKLYGCMLSYTKTQSAYWVNNGLYVKNGIIDSMSNAFLIDNMVLDNFSNGSNYMPSSYSSKDKITISGSVSKNKNVANIIRYISNGQYITNSKFIHVTITPTYSNTITPIVFTLRNVEFSQVQNNNTYETNYNNGFNADILMESSYITNTVIDFTSKCYHVTSPERPNKLVRVGFVYPLASYTLKAGSVAKFEFYETLNLKIVDTNGNPIEGANVIISNNKDVPDVYTATTDSNGDIPETDVMIYLVEYDPNNADGYHYYASNFFSKTTVFNNITLQISADGYENLTIPINGVLDKITETISLKTAIPIRITNTGATLALTPETGSSSLLKTL